MVNENKILFYSEELNEDVNQNNNLLNSKEVLIQNNSQQQINSGSYNSIVDSIDYLGCINGNCSKITCDCANNNCNCNHHNHTNNNANTNNNTNNNTNSNANTNKYTKSNNFISNLIDFLYVMFTIVILIFILYKRKSEYLIYVLGITIIYVIYKSYIITS